MGHRFYGLRCGGSTIISLVYDIDQKLWYQWLNADGTDWDEG
jgi:hypothetical protein